MITMSINKPLPSCIDKLYKKVYILLSVKVNKMVDVQRCKQGQWMLTVFLYPIFH